MKKLILIALILSCVVGGIYYSLTQQHKEKEATTQSLSPPLKSDRAQSNTRKEENKKRADFFKEQRLQKTIARIEQNPYNYNSIYDLLDNEFSRERAIEVARMFIHDDDLDRSRQAIDVLLRLQDDQDYHGIISELIKSRSSNLAYIHGLLNLHHQYRVGDTDEIVKYLIDNKLYQTRNDLGGILSKASKELQIEYVDSEVRSVFNSLQNRGKKLDLGIPDDTGKGYSDLIFKWPENEVKLMSKANKLLQIHLLHPETVPLETMEEILTIIETNRRGGSSFIRQYASSSLVDQSRLENMLLSVNDRSTVESLLVNLIMLFPESQVAKDYLVNELNKVTNITSPLVKYRLAALIDDPYINAQAPAPKSEYETPNTSLHWKYRVRQKDRSPYFWIHNYVKNYTLPN